MRSQVRFLLAPHDDLYARSLLVLERGHSTLDVIEMVTRVVQGVFEQATHVASRLADGQAPGPSIAAGVVSELGEAFSSDRQALTTSSGSASP